MSQIPPSQPSYNPEPSTGFDFGEWLNIWRRALTQPSAATFEELERHPQVTMQNSLIWNAISAAIGGFLGGVVAIFTQDASVLGVFTGAIFGALGGIVGLLIYAIIVYAICKAQGGTGTLQTQVALLGTFLPPLLLIPLLLGQIPILGGIIGLLLALYLMYLYIVATQAAQNVTMGKAALAVLLPGLVVLCCVVVFTFGLVAAILGATGLSGLNP
ncbi:MAG: hypothetical protein A2136_06560 [Chloroflexi bacterium RBG_16_54_11]|nr:MAG: hypothetical protein A2136_06560 [Chloroflexi bacterium RBG_16_54_11]